MTLLCKKCGAYTKHNSSYCESCVADFLTARPVAITGIPYRTPACNRHLPNNEDDICPWCRIKELEKELDDWKAQGFDFSPDEY